MTEFNRRQFLQIALLGTSSTILEACQSSNRSGSTAPAENVTTQPALKPAEWSQIEISSQQGIMEIADAAQFVFPDIGLRKLYFSLNAARPMLMVIPLWDPKTNRNYYTASVKPDGIFGFQEYREPFVPDANQTPFGITEQIIPKSEAQPFYIGTLDQIHQLEGGQEQPLDNQMKQRPDPYKRYILVFGRNVTEYKRNPSPAAVLRARFIFDPLTLSPAKNST